MEKMGYQILVTVLLPGALLLAAVWLLLGTFFRDSQAYYLTAQYLQQEWMAAGGTILIAALLGTLLGSVMDSLETMTYDRHTARELGLDDDDYWEEWLKYVDSLTAKSNAFIDQMSLYFFFESRTGIATLILAVVWLVTGWGGSERLLALLLAAVGGVLLYASVESHYILAEYRHRHFAATGGLSLAAAPTAPAALEVPPAGNGESE